MSFFGFSGFGGASPNLWTGLAKGASAFGQSVSSPSGGMQAGDTGVQAPVPNVSDLETWLADFFKKQQQTAPQGTRISYDNPPPKPQNFGIGYDLYK